MASVLVEEFNSEVKKIKENYYVHRNALRKLPDRNIRQENNCH